MKWKVDYNELIPFLGRTIYKPENVLVELCANSYDADASRVEISTSGESQQILIKDNGCGMGESDIDELCTIAKSKKRIMVQKGKTTPKHKRKLLGCFGIGIVSFLALGDTIKIFTLKEGGNTRMLEIKRTINETSGETKVEITDPVVNDDFKQHLLKPENGTTIEISNNKLDLVRDYGLIRHKLSNLPLSNKFKIFLNKLEIKKEDFDETNWFNKEFDFTLEKIDASYKSKCRIHVNTETTIENYKRGVFLVVNGRVIEKDLYYALYQELASPAAIAARVIGHVEADYLGKVIQANREDFFDNVLITEIKNALKGPIQKIINDYMQQRSTEGEEKAYNKLLQRVESSKIKFSAPNEDLKRLGINFTSNPEFEQELVLIIAQLCQKKLLPFQILDYNTSSHIDCIVKWPLEQAKRDPDFTSELEVELTLAKFLEHNHDFRIRPDICCWQIKQADLTRTIASYKEGHPDSIVNIELKEATDSEHFHHQKELHFTIKSAYNVQTTHILRVYVVSDIVKNACMQPN